LLNPVFTKHSAIRSLTTPDHTKAWHLAPLFRTEVPCNAIHGSQTVPFTQMGEIVGSFGMTQGNDNLDECKGESAHSGWILSGRSADLQILALRARLSMLLRLVAVTPRNLSISKSESHQKRRFGPGNRLGETVQGAET
jgi:hypothetical protein